MTLRGFGVAFAGLALGFVALAAYAAERPWEDAGALSNKVYNAIAVGGIARVEPHAAAIEDALAAAPALFPATVVEGSPAIVLTDGQAETLMALTQAALDGKGDVAAVNNPYPILAMYLGSFYVETGRYDDALRVLETGLALSPDPDALLGATVPDLLAERGITLGRLLRWDEALASYERALGVPGLSDSLRGVMLRGRGFVFIELGRLDEAEAAYTESLTYAPGNEIALNELGYIAALRGGMAPTDPVLTIPGEKQKGEKTK